jgi:S1-C subfamily serine protease
VGLNPIEINKSFRQLPDSIRAAIQAVGASCNFIPTEQDIVEMVHAKLNGPRPALGVQFKGFTPQDTAGYGLPPNTRGLLIVSATGYGAVSAGIVPGDVILKINGKSMASINDFLQQSIKWKEGESVKLEVVHKGGAHQKMSVVTTMKK